MSEELWTNSLRKPKIIYKQLIGKGTFGEVWLAEWKGTEVAAKRIHKKFFEAEYDQEIREDLIREFNKEWEVLQTLDHQNVVKMHTVLLPPKKSPVIVMELMHCDLQQYMRQSTSTPKISPSKVVTLGLGIGQGLVYLHGRVKPIVHRDIAPKNILLSKHGHPKIADLGIAKVFSAVEDASATPNKGTPLYAAPETYKNIKQSEATYGVKADIFSFGVVLLEINVGHEPRFLPSSYSGAKITELKRRQNDLHAMQDDTLKNIVISCLQEKGSRRPTATKIVADLQRIRDARGKLQCDQAATFEKLYQKPSSSHYHFKALLLGNCSVGKSCLFEVLNNPVHVIDTAIKKATVTLFPAVHYFKYNADIVKMEIADTSGEEKNFSLTSSYYCDVDGVFLTYSVSDKVSLRSLKFWISQLKKYNRKENFVMLLVGNKVDLRETTTPEELVPQERALGVAEGLECPYVETSAKDIDSVMAMYKKMIEMLVSTVSPEDIRETEDIKIILQSSPKKSTSKISKCCK